MRLVCKTHVPYRLSFIKERFNRQFQSFVSSSLGSLINIDTCHRNELGRRTTFSLGNRPASVESEYVSVYKNESEISLVSEFIKLPYGVLNMRHYQKVRVNDDQSCNVFEEISFSTRKKWLEVLYKPVILFLLNRRLKHTKRFFDYVGNTAKRTTDTRRESANNKLGRAIQLTKQVGNSDPVLSRI